MGVEPTPTPDLLSTPAAGPAAIRGGSVRLAGFVVGVAMSVGSAALLFRHLGVVDTGRYVAVLSLVAIVGGVSDAGLTAIGMRELSVRAAGERDRLMRNLLGLRIVLTGAGMVLAVAFAAAAGYGGLLVLGTVLAGIGLLLQSVQQTLAISLMAGLRLGWVTAADLLRQVVNTVLIIGLVLVGAGLLAFLGIPIAASLAALVLTAVLVRADIPLVPAFHRADWRALVRDVLPYSIAVAAGVLYFRIAILLLSVIEPGRETGYFGASFRIVDVLAAIPALMMATAFPIFSRAARDDHERLAYALDRVYRTSFIAGGAMALALVLGAPVAIDVVAGPGFEPAVDVLRVQAITVGATYVGVFWGHALLSLRMHREILAINLVALAAVSVLVAVLAAADGARGAALGTAGAELALLVIYPLVLARRRRELVPSARFLPGVGVCLAGAGAVALTGLPALAQVPIALAVYATLLVALRLLPEELLVEVKALARRRARG